MTKKEEIQARRRDILQGLQLTDRDHPIPLADLMEKYSASRRTIYDDIKALQESGYKVENLSKKGFYLMEESEQNPKPAKTSSDQTDEPNQTTRKNSTEYAYKRNGLYRKSRVESFQDVMLMITIQLNEKPMTLDEIVDAYERVSSYESEDPASLQTAVYRKVGQLVEQGYLVEDEGRYQISLSAPVYLKLTEEQIEDLNDLILLYGQDVTHAKTLAGIAERLRAVYEGGMLGEDRKSSGIGLHRIRGDEVQREVDLINRYAYDRRLLTMSYEGRTGDRSEIKRFATGLLIYASDKDRLYLIGRCEEMIPLSKQEKMAIPLDPSAILVLDVARILDIREEEEKNPDFQSEEYMKMFRQMLVVDVNPPEQVKVEIETGNRNLIRKFERHVRTRNEGYPEGLGCASLTNQGEKYLYADTVRGLEELARFLRQYGRGVTVKEPEALREKMAFTAERALERYGVK